jgi:hypothetical protein
MIWNLFNVHGSVHRKNILIYVYPTRYNVTQFILSGNCSRCFRWYHHPPLEAQTPVSTASGICHTVTAICRYRGRIGTGLSVLWVVYTTHSTLHPKHVFHFPDKINCVTLPLVGYILEYENNILLMLFLKFNNSHRKQTNWKSSTDGR